MEKYVIDLDKVLDELELCDNDEAAGQNYGQNHSSSLSNSYINSSTDPSQNFYKFPASSIVNAYDKIDVRDADFSIQTKPPKILNSISTLNSASRPYSQRESVLNNNNTNNTATNHGSVYHFTDNVQPAVQPSTEAVSSSGPENSSSSLRDEGHFIEAINEELLTHVQPVANVVVENTPSHGDDNNPKAAAATVVTSSTVDNDSANDVCHSEAEDKGSNEMIDFYTSIDANLKLDDAITNVEVINEVHSDNRKINQSQPEELVNNNNNNFICDNAIIEESVATSSADDSVHPTVENETVTSSDLVAAKEVEEEDEITTSDFTESSTAPLEDYSSPVENVEREAAQTFAAEEAETAAGASADTVNDAVNEAVLGADSTVPLTDSPPLDINNMSEEELDRYLSDLVALESAGSAELANSNTTTADEAVLVKDCDEKLSETQHNATSQLEKSDSVIEDNCVQPTEGHTLAGEEAIITGEVAQSTDSAPSAGNEATLVPVDDAATAVEQCQVDAAIESAANDQVVETCAIVTECDSSDSFPVSTDRVEESVGSSSNTTEHPESARPSTLTLSGDVPTEELVEAAGELQQADCIDAPTTSTEPTHSDHPQPSTSTGEADNRGGLVLSTYFERQEMPNGLTEEEQTLGKVKPFWIPDDDAQNCLHCDAKFTFIKRRHHCRSCGKVLCSQCCNFKAKLMYLENKEERVCQLCYAILIRIEEIEKVNGHPIDISQIEQPSSSSSASVDGPHLNVNGPDPNNPSEYCSTISPFDQASDAQTRPPPSVMVPVGVLKRPGSAGYRRAGAGGGGNSSESSQDRSMDGPVPMPVKQVIFSDGVRPGGDLVEDQSPSTSRLPEERPVGRTQLQLKSPPVEKPFPLFEQSSKRLKPSRVAVLDNHSVNLPPIVNYNELKSIDGTLPSKPTYRQLVDCLRSTHLPAVTFGLTKNLFVNTKLVSKLCCNSVECWAFASRGLATVGQDEVFFCLDCSSLERPPTVTEDGGEKGSATTTVAEADLPDFPRDVFRLFTAIYDSASKASLFTELSHIFFPDGLFGNKENSGFIFTRPSLQCFQNVLLPSPPNLIAILIHKWEIPWAKVFPLRLALRLGHEYSTYPTPVISFANRKPAYFEIGHTIMNVLADFRNFQYTLSVVKDLVIHVEERKRVSLQIPKLSYEKVSKVMSTCNEHVLAFGGNFSVKADSHFVCVQNEQDEDVHGQYHTKVASFNGSPQKITGASFIVFSGALKSGTGLKAKMNIVEDGLLVQIPPTTMEELRAAIRDMKEFQIDCCKVTETESPEEWIRINWVNDELSTNLGVRSQIDGLNLEGVQSARIFSSPDYTNERYLIRWIEVFLLQINENSRRSEMLNTSRLAESVSQAFCVALIDFLDQLYESGLTKIGLRISLDVDKVGYESGSAGEQLPAQFTSQLDSALIPAIMENISTTGIEDPLVIELLFYILLK